MPTDKTALSRCDVTRTLVERVTVVGPMDLDRQVADELHAQGYRMTHAGPYSDKKMFPRVDPTRFLYHGERERKAN